MPYTIKDYQTSADYIKSRIPTVPSAAIILGSGLGDFADELDSPIIIKYEDIPSFPRSTVQNHKGELIFGYVSGKPLLAMNGRFHYYEGYDMAQTAYPVAVFGLLGIKKLIITNASGCINRSIHPGDIVCVDDHIKLCAESPLRGKNIDELGQRFIDMQSVYSSEMIKIAQDCAIRQGFSLSRGVYAYMSGPQYETPAEIRMLRAIGADLVGMSTVAEVIQAAHCGIEVLCLSCVSNYAAGLTSHKLSHSEVCEMGEQIRGRLTLLVKGIVEEIG